MTKLFRKRMMVNLTSIASSISPGHRFLLHCLNSADLPSSLQLLPPYFGFGLSQVRRHISIPSPHVTLHGTLKLQFV